MIDFPIGSGRLGHYYYRDDVELPPLNIDGIDMLGFRDKSQNNYSTIIDDKATIEKFFNVIGQAYQKDSTGHGLVYDIGLMNSQFEGIEIDMPVSIKDGSYWIEVTDDNFAIIPQDLLEKIAGKKLPTPEDIQMEWDAED
ncbi:hypothetical protein SDC9_200940 [bioreactor metagenome]|uniref:Uncharacterized protein n=1 Tax=bioreactor metagenome TaxID=1076179 RepID=A0A645IQA7_9ZZZZ